MDLLELFIFTYYIWYTNKIQKHTFVVSISENRLSSDVISMHMSCCLYLLVGKFNVIKDMTRVIVI